MEELIINFWIYVDLQTEVIYNWSAKVYCISGSDNDKTTFLKGLADTDYKTASRRLLSDKLQYHLGSKVLQGNIPSSSFDDYFDSNSEWFCLEVEKTIPPKIIFSVDIDKCKAIPQKLPESPLYVLTYLIENDIGELVPSTTPENK